MSGKQRIVYGIIGVFLALSSIVFLNDRIVEMTSDKISKICFGALLVLSVLVFVKSKDKK